MNARTQRLRSLIEEGFAPVSLTIEDDSARHAGHAGARPEGGTHYRVAIVSAAFRGLGRLARARAVHEALGPEFAGGLHALSLDLRTPEEIGQ